MADGMDRLLSAFSAGRMEPYLKVCGGDLSQAFCLYTWNIEASAALNGPLHCCEIVLRNALHNALGGHFGQADWWNHRKIVLDRYAKKSLRDAEEKLRRRRRDVTPDRIVAELSLGFWVGLVGKGLNYETQLWRPALRRAFPHYDGQRSALHEQLETIRRLRNRISHLEPIHHRHLAADYAKILCVMGYIAPAAVEFVRPRSRVLTVLARREDVRRGNAASSF